jgi:hypothetical protein
MNDNSIMPFGKYKGKKLIEVPAKHLLDLYHEGTLDEYLTLYEYVVKNVFELEDRSEKEFRDKRLTKDA